MKYKENFLSKTVFSFREANRKTRLFLKKLGKAFQNKREYFESFVDKINKKTKTVQASSASIEGSLPYAKTVSGGKFIVGEDRLAVYTCVFGDYDDVDDPLISGQYCDYYIVTDRPVSPKSKWKQIEPKEYPKDFESWHPAIKNRFFKMHPNVLFPDRNYSLYVDGNIKLVTDMYPFLIQMKNCPSIFGLFNHPVWNCLYEMTDILKEEDLVDSQGADLQLKLYLSEGFPKKWGLFECGFILREHNNLDCKKTMDIWWNEYMNGEKRDQMCFTYALWKNGFHFSDVCNFGNNWRKSSRLKEKAHNRPHRKVTQ